MPTELCSESKIVCSWRGDSSSHPDEWPRGQNERDTCLGIVIQKEFLGSLPRIFFQFEFLFFGIVVLGPRAELDEGTVSESIMTGRHLLGCAACGAYRRYTERHGTGQVRSGNMTGILLGQNLRP
jgi:hypothetical protein